MIEKLKIQNFQSHQKSELQFSPGVNIIVGESDSGKSAIIRALRWVIQNRPVGDAFRSVWADFQSVELTTDDDHTITRRKEKKDNKYIVNNQELKAVRTDIPEQVSKALNINDINLQKQLDRPFLLDLSPGEVARHFNHIANLNVIDKSLKSVESNIRRIEQEIKAENNNITYYQQELQNYQNIPKFEAELRVLEDLSNTCQKNKSTQNNITTIVNSISTIADEIEERQDFISAENDIDNILALFAEQKELKKYISSMNEIVLSTYNINKELKKEEDLYIISDKVDSLLEVMQQSKAYKSDLMNLEYIIDATVKNNTKIEGATSEIQELEHTFNKEMPDVCPLCEQKIKN